MKYEFKVGEMTVYSDLSLPCGSGGYFLLADTWKEVPVSEGRKDDGTKVRVDLVPPEGIEAAARAFGYGEKKYAAWNWAKGMAWLRLYGATVRHLLAWVGRQEADPESGLNHLDHAMASLMMLRAHVARSLGVDDRPTYTAVQAAAKPHLAERVVPTKKDSWQQLEMDLLDKYHVTLK